MNLNVKLFAVILIACHLSQLAQGDFTYKGRTYKDEVDLSYQYPDRYARQREGSCHVFSGTALFESACYRYTGKNIKLSEGYLLNLHLKDRNKYYFGNVINGNESGNATNFDGGSTNDTVKRIRKGQACLERTFPYERYSDILHATVNAEKNKMIAIQSKVSKTYHPTFFESWMLKTIFTPSEPQRWADFVDSRFMRVFQERVDENMNQSCETESKKDPDLNQCLDLNLKIHNSFFTYSKALQLLNQDISFACSILLGDLERHTVNIIGYTLGSDGKPVFFSRDSAEGKKTYPKLKCLRISYLTSDRAKPTQMNPPDGPKYKWVEQGNLVRDDMLSLCMRSNIKNGMFESYTIADSAHCDQTDSYHYAWDKLDSEKTWCWKISDNNGARVKLVGNQMCPPLVSFLNY